MHGLSFIVFLAVVVGAVAIGLTFIRRELGDAKPGGASDRYQLRPSILSAAERSFAGVLNGALPDGVTWLAKVRVGDIVVTRQGLSPAQRAGAWNRVNQKHVDFLLVRASDFFPLLAIELDDKSHEAESRKSRDAFVNDVLCSCRLTIAHVPARKGYNLVELRQQIQSLIAANRSAAV